MSRTYVCQTCGYESPEPGNCPDCGEDLEEMCLRCGNSKSECVCEVGEEEEEVKEEK